MILEMVDMYTNNTEQEYEEQIKAPLCNISLVQ